MTESTTDNEISEQHNKERNSNFELLRILCMLMIVAFHFVGGTENFIVFPSDPTINLTIYRYIGLWGKTAVLVFIMISGYFMINKTIKIKKIVTLWIEVLFYSVIITLIMLQFGIIQFSSTVLLYTFFPIMYEEYWFVTDYILLMLMSPFINIMLKNLTKKQHLSLVILLFVTGSCILTFTPMVESKLGNLLTFISFYSIAAYIKLYPNHISESLKYNVNAVLTIIVSSFILIYFMELLYFNHNSISYNDNYYLFAYVLLSLIILFVTILSKSTNKAVLLLFELVLILCFGIVINMTYMSTGVRGWIERIDSPFVGFSAIFLFLMFKNIQIKKNKIINWVAGSVFGVYLIHEHHFLREYIWRNMVEVDLLINQYCLVLIVVYIISVFIVCIIIDKVRECAFSVVEEHTKSIKKAVENKVIDTINQICRYYKLE